MRNHIFSLYFWCGFLVFTLALFFIDVYAIRSAWLGSVDRLRQQLESSARILAAETPTSVQAWVKTASDESGVRVIVIDPHGNVAGDSAPDNGIGNGLSVATPFPAAGPGSTLQLSASLDGIRATVSQLRTRLLAGSLFTIALLQLVSYLFRRAFRSRIDRLRTYIEGLPDATLPDEGLPSGADGLGPLTRSLRQNAPKMRALLDNLKLEGARREAILSSMVEGVLAVDKQLRVTFCNKSFARTIGASMPVAEGMPLLDLIRDPALRDILVTVLREESPVERRIQLRGVQSRSFEVQAAPLAGLSARGALAILHDITELERLERVRRDFVANVSHELRTPLAAIRGYAETLLDGALEDLENNRKFVEIILAHAIRLNNIATDLLILSELESSGAQAQPGRVSVRGVVESAQRTVESAARVRGVKVLAGRMEDLQVLGYEIRLEQAFVNLLDNAIKFNRPNGEVRIDSAVENGKAVVTISDTGIGIPSDDLPRIFERFYRVDKARSRAAGGTGLGLSIVRHVLEQMGGSIRVESELGKGSRFAVVVPLAEAPVSVVTGS